MQKSQVRMDAQGGPVVVDMRVLTPLFAEVTIYYHLPTEVKWTRAAHFDISEVDDGQVSTTVPALPPGSEMLLRVVLWGGDKGFIVRTALRQQQQDCHGSPLAEVKSETGSDKGEVVDIQVEVV